MIGNLMWPRNMKNNRNKNCVGIWATAYSNLIAYCWMACRLTHTNHLKPEKETPTVNPCVAKETKITRRSLTVTHTRQISKSGNTCIICENHDAWKRDNFDAYQLNPPSGGSQQRRGKKNPGVKAFRNKNQHVQTANQAKEREVVMQVPCVARTSTSNPLINQ